MRELLNAETTINQSIEYVWDHLVSIDKWGHLWLPHTSAVIRKTPAPTGEHSLFNLSHFSSDSLCIISRLTADKELDLTIVNDYAKIIISIRVITGQNGVQVRIVVRGQLSGWRCWLGPLAYWYMRHVFMHMPQRIRKMVAQPE